MGRLHRVTLPRPAIAPENFLADRFMSLLAIESTIFQCRWLAKLTLLLWVCGLSHGQGAILPSRPERILIQPKATTDGPSLDSLHRAKGSRKLRQFHRFAGIQVIEVPKGKTASQLLEAYRQSALIEVAEPDFRVESIAAPSDPNYRNGALWYLNQLDVQGNHVGPDIQAALAWETKTNADDIVVALIDTGARLTHEDLAGNLWNNPKEIPGNGVDDDGNGFIDDVHGIDAANQNGNPTDLVGHGSRVAGVIGGVGDNGRGGIGVAWKVQMMICRYSNDSGQGNFSDILECFDYARANGAKIINASFGSTNTSSLLLTALNACRTAGIIVVAGAGNNGVNNDVTPFYPASYALDNVVSVAATTRSDELASYSNFGLTSVDLAAPGTDVLSTASGADDQYRFDSGTSYSTAITSASLALLWARFPTETYTQIIQRLLTSVDPITSLAGKCVTGGRLNLARALGPSLVAEFVIAPASSVDPRTVQLTDTSFGAITQHHWSFGDGTTSTEASPTHTFPYYGTYTVTLTVTTGTGKRATLEREINISPVYTSAPATYTWLTPANATVLSLSNDGVSAAQAIPFPFSYFGTVRNQLLVGANGLAGFSAAGLTKATNTDLPNTSAPNDFLSPYWSDLVPSGVTTISVGTAGTSPNRRWVITWSRISLPAPRAATVNFQIVLHEGTSEITFNYQEVAANSGNANASGRRATIGLEGPGGDVGTRFSYLGSVLVTNNQAIRWTPPAAWPSPGLLQAVPSTASLNSSGAQGGPFTPLSQLVAITNSGGSALPWQATSTVEWLNVTPSSGTLLPGANRELEIVLTSQASLLVPGSYPGEIRVNAGSLVIPYVLQVYRNARLLVLPSIATDVFSFQIQGDPAVDYVVEGSTDLKLWIPLSTNQTDSSGIFSSHQAITPQLPIRFFRAIRIDLSSSATR